FDIVACKRLVRKRPRRRRALIIASVYPPANKERSSRDRQKHASSPKEAKDSRDLKPMAPHMDNACQRQKRGACEGGRCPSWKAARQGWLDYRTYRKDAPARFHSDSAGTGGDHSGEPDRYGGSIANRSRFLIQVVDAVSAVA